MFGTYQSCDVTILLKDITGLVEPMGTREREAKIQSGTHYSEMLPVEYEPSSAYLAAYQDALDRYAGMTAEAVAAVAGQIWRDNGEHAVLVSLARAGIQAPSVFQGLEKLMNALCPARPLSACGMTEDDVEGFVENIFAAKQRLLAAGWTAFTREDAAGVYRRRLGLDQ